MFEQFLLRAKVVDWDYDEHKLYKKWVEGYIHPTSITTDGPTWGFTTTDRANCYSSTHEIECYEPKTYSFIKDTVGRWTGLLDKNGKKIYEGDILKWETLGSDYMYLVVRFDNGGWAAYPCNDLDRKHMRIRLGGEQSYCEVIGNKWDNPELLEGSE